MRIKREHYRFFLSLVIMPILALETATEACSVALYLDSGQVISRYQVAPRLQTQLLLPMIDELLAEAQLSASALTAIAYSRGPGSFTGVRIAAAAAQGLAFGWDLPVIAISSLQTLAQTAYRLAGYTHVLAAFDARMNEIYLGAYTLQGQIMQPVMPEVVCSPQQVPVILQDHWALVGDGASYNAQLQAQIQTILHTQADIYPHAYDLAILASIIGHAQAPELALPVYLRDSVWQKLANKS